MRPDAEAEEADEHARVCHDRISEQGLLGVGRQHFGHQAEGGENEDVDLRVPEDPEQVLPEQRVGARPHGVERGAEEAVELQEHERYGDHRKRQNDQELRHERHPGEHRHAHQVHAWRAQIDDGRDEVERSGEGRNTEDLQSQHPEIHVRAGRVRAARQWGVAEPSTVGCDPEEDGQRDEDAAEQKHPVTERIEAGEGDVARADLQRNEIIEERRRQRHDGKEDHRGAVHGEELIVLRRREHRSIWCHELPAHQNGFKATEHEKEERRVEV